MFVTVALAFAIHNRTQKGNSSSSGSDDTVYNVSSVLLSELLLSASICRLLPRATRRNVATFVATLGLILALDALYLLLRFGSVPHI